MAADLKSKRPVRHQVRLTPGQAKYITDRADSTYRTPQQVLQMLVDQAILADGYHSEADKPEQLR